MKFSFMAEHRVMWPAGWLCAALGVSRGGFYAGLTRPRSQRSRSDKELGAKVRASFLASDRAYGARPRVVRPAGGWSVVRAASDRMIDAATGT
jgi:putative transposase